jgi:hypothetical protein
LRDLKDFGRKFDLLIIIVAHPTKAAITKNPEELTLYDVSDSAAFQNKSDLGVVIARLGDVTIDKLTGVFVRKTGINRILAKSEPSSLPLILKAGCSASNSPVSSIAGISRIPQQATKHYN